MNNPSGGPFRVAIVGGGICGATCALCIHRTCTEAGVPVSIDVYEQAGEYGEVGAGVGVGLNAARLLHGLGVGGGLNAISGDLNGCFMRCSRYDNSDEILLVPADDRGEVRHSPCARSDLLDVLLDAIRGRGAATMHTKKACRGIDDAGAFVRLTFADGTTAEADLLLGCDGIHSTIRSRFVDDEPVYSGLMAYRGVVPLDPSMPWRFPTYSVMWHGRGRHFYVYPLAGNTKLNVIGYVTTPGGDGAGLEESWTAACDLADVIADYEGFDEPVQRIIRQMPSRPSKWKIMDREPLAKWHHMGGKVVLLGDAAHAMQPHLGGGAGQGLEDCWVLGRAVGEYLSGSTNRHFRSLESTAQLYQDVRLPRAQAMQAMSRATGLEFEMRAPGMEDKSFEECVAIFVERQKHKMGFVWGEDLDVSYEKVRDGRPD